VSSATISEQGRILYVWTGEEWVPVNAGAGGSGSNNDFISSSSIVHQEHVGISTTIVGDKIIFSVTELDGGEI
jgi:hypothetical protein